MSSYSYSIFADYYQFYLQDEGTAGDLSDAWTNDAVTNLLAVAPGTIGVGTVRNMDVPVVVEILESERMETFDDWDQVNECEIEIPSGTIVIAGCTDYFPEAARIQVEPGSYRARLFYGQLNSLSEDGVNGDDHYRVVLWKSEAAKGIKVVKKR